MNTAMAINSAQSEFIGGSNTNPSVDEAKGEEQAQQTFRTVSIEVVQLCGSFFTSFKQARDYLQSALITAAIRADKGETVDVEYIVAKLEEADGKNSAGLNAPGVVWWINNFTKAHIEYDKKEGRHMVRYAADKQTRLEEAKAKPWYECAKPKADWTGYSVFDSLQLVLKSHNGKCKEKVKLEEANDPRALQVQTDPELVAAIRRLMADRNLIAFVNNGGVVPEPVTEAA